MKSFQSVTALMQVWIWSNFFLFGSAQAATTIIHAVGISQKHPDRNYDSFYENAQSLLSYCRSNGLRLGQDCKVFVDLSVPGDSKVIASLKASPGILGTAAPDRVLETFRRALDSAKAGDQVVFSLDNHGSPGPVNASCVFTGPSPTDAICMRDVKAILDKWKKPGVKVFISADACMSGAFSELSSREVCTLVAADRYISAEGSHFWRAVAETKIPRTPLSLKEMNDFFRFHSDLDLSGGGFGSQVIKNRVCLKQWGGTSLPDRNKLASTVRDSFRKVELEVSSIFGKNWNTCGTCAGSSSERAFSNVWNLAGQMDLIQKDLGAVIGAAAKLEQKYCIGSDPASDRLCNALRDYSSQVRSTGLSEVQTLLREFEKQRNRLIEFDEKLYGDTRNTTSASRKAIFEAQRGELNKAYFDAQARMGREVREKLQLGKFKNLLGALKRIDEELCSDRKRKGMKISEFVLGHLTLSTFSGDRVPKTDQSLKDALACESSFMLP